MDEQDRNLAALRRIVGAGSGLVHEIVDVAETVLGHPREDDPEAPRYIPDELLLTFTSGTAMPNAEDPRVMRLLHQAEAIAGIGKLDWADAPTRRRRLLEAKERAIEDEMRRLEERERAGADGVSIARQRRALDEERRRIEQRERNRDGQAPEPESALLAQLPLTLRVPLPAQGKPVMGRDQVKVAVDRINSQLDRLQDGGIAVSSALPNWILSGAGGHAMGGPGTTPDPAPGDMWEFKVPDAGAWPEGAEAPRESVIAAVLDTWPGRQSLIDARGKNALMDRLAADGAIQEWECDELSPEVPPRFTYANADHGLFVCGIIASIAPKAKIHLLHVLDENGLGSTDRLLCALEKCLRLAQSGQRVVVNMSLYLLIPPDDAPLTFWDVWFRDDPEYHHRTPQQNAALLELLDEPVEQAVTLLLDAGAVVVAAAGNDALVIRKHVQPRLPADYDTAFCVVATDRAGYLARYSNRADVPLTGNCVATWGGQGVVSGPHVVVPPPPPDPRDGVVSIYSQPTIVVGDGVATTPGTPNDSGWVYWSGTSFAAPIISAIAANVLAKNERAYELGKEPRLTPRGVMKQVLDMAEAPPDPAVGCPYLPVSQVNRQPGESGAEQSAGSPISAS